MEPRPRRRRRAAPSGAAPLPRRAIAKTVSARIVVPTPNASGAGSTVAAGEGLGEARRRSARSSRPARRARRRCRPSRAAAPAGRPGPRRGEPPGERSPSQRIAAPALPGCLPSSQSTSADRIGRTNADSLDRKAASAATAATARRPRTSASSAARTRTVARRSVVAENQSAAARFCGARNMSAAAPTATLLGRPSARRSETEQDGGRRVQRERRERQTGQAPRAAERPPEQHPERPVVLAPVQIADERQERIADVAREGQEEVIVAEEGRRGEKRHGGDDRGAPARADRAAWRLACQRVVARVALRPSDCLTARGARSLRRGEGRRAC